MGRRRGKASCYDREVEAGGNSDELGVAVPLRDNQSTLSPDPALVVGDGEVPRWGTTSCRLSGRLLNSRGEFDPGSGRTLAACLRYASRTGDFGL